MFTCRSGDGTSCRRGEETTVGGTTTCVTRSVNSHKVGSKLVNPVAFLSWSDSTKSRLAKPTHGT